MLNKGIVWAKIQTAHDVDAAPTGALNAILAEDISIEPTMKKMQRGDVRPYMGAMPHVNLGESMTVKYKTELKGSGVVGTPPEIGPLHRMTGYTETIVLNTSVAYAPHSKRFHEEGAEEGTIWAWKGNRLHKIINCRGNWTLTKKAGEIVYMEWTFQGIYAGPLDALAQTGVPNATVPAPFVSANFAIGGYAAVVEQIKINAGGSLAKRADCNAPTGVNQIFIKEREVTGELDPEAPAALNSGAINELAAIPTVAGTGYTVGDILPITTGGTGATARVLTITGGSGTGPVGTVELVTRGKDYTAGTGKVTSGGTGTGCTLAITSVFTTEAYDFWTKLSSNDLLAFTSRVGSTAGNICTITAPKVQVDNIKYGDRENTLTEGLTITFIPNIGNDEIVFTYT